MDARSLAHREVETLLGSDALRDSVWRDIRSFEATATPIVVDLWNLNREEPQNVYALMYPVDEEQRRTHHERLAQAEQRLRRKLSPDVLARCAGAFVLHPQLWRQANGRGGYDARHYHHQALYYILGSVADGCLQAQQPTDWTSRLGQRLYDLCTVPALSDRSGGLYPAYGVDTAGFCGCVNALLECQAATTEPEIVAFLDALTIGDWRQAWQHIEDLSGHKRSGLTRVWNALVPEMVSGVLRAETPVQELKRFWQAEGAAAVVTLLARLDTMERLDMHAFRRLLEAVPACLPTINAFLDQNPDDNQASGDAAASPWLALLPNAGFRDRLRKLVDGVVWELVSDLRPEVWPVLVRMTRLDGGRYLLRLVEEVERRGLERLRASPYGYWHAGNNIEAILSLLLSKLQRRPDDDRAMLVALLQQAPVPALLAVLPHARAYEGEICAALGWDGSLAMVELLHRLEQDDPARSTDPTVGVVQQDSVLRISARLGEEHTRILIDAFAHHRPSAVVLAQAALGWNRTEVRRMFGRRKPIAARALPLLPFAKGDSPLACYLALTNYQRQANTSGAGKKAVERAAAEAGLTNLALRCGYADATRLEWAMQDQLGAEGIGLGHEWKVEDYTLSLRERESHPVIEVRKGERVLKRTPSVVTRDYVYREVRATRDQLKEQRHRFCQAFINAMRRGDSLSPDELAILRRNPLAVALLERLVLKDESGAFGLFRAEDNALEGYHGDRVRCTGALSIAHPYDLAQADILGDWQTEIVRRQIVQPFKQVFRELYLVTPAEEKAVYSSARFAGRRLKGRQASAVLANMGWRLDGGAVNKPFYELGYAARFETGHDWYWGDAADDYAETTGALTFWPLTVSPYEWGWSRQGERRVALSAVPPRVLSEVLRDLDLVTVVAHHADELGTSREVLRRRGELVRATVEALGLGCVEVDEPHVLVDGRRARYRIHLATAAIHIESGSYLCIVPRAKSRKATYLPFEDGGDPVSSELVSKVLLLANDSAITDPTILAQLPASRRAA